MLSLRIYNNMIIIYEFAKYLQLFYKILLIEISPEISRKQHAEG